jgi:hypothetical protein
MWYFGWTRSSRLLPARSFEETPMLTSWPVDRIVCPDSLGRGLLAAAARGAEQFRHVPVLGRHGELPESSRRGLLRDEARAGAVPPGAVAAIDAEAVAAWITEHYPEPSYPAVLLGSPHGAAVHLAAALGAAWLPTAFTVTVPWPGGSAADWSGALDWGAGLADRILAANRTVTVRQVHDPVARGPLSAATVSLHVRWRRLPAAYLDFLASRLAPGGVSMFLRDLRTWPVVERRRGHTFQIGSPMSGWSYVDYDRDNPAFCRLLGPDAVHWARPNHDNPLPYAETAGDPALGVELRRVAAETHRPSHRVLYANPATLSACVADLYRAHLRTTRGGGDQCLVETGRLLDPGQVLAAGLVPYWCESPSRHATEAAGWWLAGSRGFDSVTVLPEPPGVRCDAYADLARWRALAAFARHRGEVDLLAASRYPLLPLAAGHATRVVLRTADEPHPAAPTMTAEQVLSSLRQSGDALGLLVG